MTTEGLLQYIINTHSTLPGKCELICITFETNGIRVMKNERFQYNCREEGGIQVSTITYMLCYQGIFSNFKR